MRKTFKYRVVNNDKNTAWKVGAIIERCTHWDGTGHAVFSFRGHVAINAHITEVKPISRSAAKQTSMRAGHAALIARIEKHGA